MCMYKKPTTVFATTTLRKSLFRGLTRYPARPRKVAGSCTNILFHTCISQFAFFAFRGRVYFEECEDDLVHGRHMFRENAFLPQPSQRTFGLVLECFRNERVVPPVSEEKVEE